MSLPDALLGVAELTVVLGLCALAGRSAAEPGAPRAERALAWGLAATAWVLAVHLVPLVLGALAWWSVLLCALAAPVLAARLPRGGSTPLRAPAPSGPSGRGAVVLAWLGAAAVALAATAQVLALLEPPPLRIDELAFHLPQVARWMQTGSLWQLDQFIADLSNATYPQHGDVLLLAVVRPLSSVALVEYVPPLFWAGTGVAVAATARALGAGGAVAVLVAATLLSVPIVAGPALEGVLTDAPLLFGLACGVLFWLRGRRGLAVVGLGIAFGTKWYGVSSVPVVLVALLVAAWPGWRAALLAAAGVAAVGGIWLVRNWVETGNPVFPAAPPPFAPPDDRVRPLVGFTLLDYAGDPAVWRDTLAAQFAAVLGWGGALLAALAVLGAALARTRALVALAVGGAALVLVYAATPYSAIGPAGEPLAAGVNVRYGVPALMVGAVVAAAALARRGATVPVALLLLAGIADGLRRWAGDVDPAAFAAAAALLAAGVLVVRARRRLAVPAVAAAVVALVALALRPVSYAPYEPVFAWLEATAPAGARVGLAGRWGTGALQPALPAFGPRLDNEVAYVGEFAGGFLRAYERPERFAAALGRFDVLVVGLGGPFLPPVPEAAWARRAGWREAARSGDYVAFVPPFRPERPVPSTPS